MIVNQGKTISILENAKRFLGLGLLMSFFFICLPSFSLAQDDGGDTKEKTEKVKKEKVKKEKPPKEKKEKKAKKPKKEKPAKKKKEKKKKKKESTSEDDGSADGGGDDDSKRKKKKKKKKKKRKKGDESEDDAEDGASESDGANTANERFHSNNADSTVKHGRAVPCARYRKGKMEYIDKNNVYVAIKRTRRRETHINSNKGIHGKKEPKMKKGKSKDKGNKLVFKIEWQTDCEYKLIFKRSKKPTKYKKGWEMDCRIIACYEDFYDCDCNIHEIIQYASIHKRLTKRELAQREVIRQDSINAAKADSVATEEEIARVAEAEAEAKERENFDEIFGPIRKTNKSENTEAKGEEEDKGEGNRTADPKVEETEPEVTTPEETEASAKKEKKPKEKKKQKEKKDKKEKSDKKEDKPPKEKKTKAPKEKKEKAPKEKKVKAPKEKKAKEPKEKKEKVPKEKKEKPPKEKKEKKPKEKKEKPAKPEDDGEE